MNKDRPKRETATATATAIASVVILLVVAAAWIWLSRQAPDSNEPRIGFELLKEPAENEPGQRTGELQPQTKLPQIKVNQPAVELPANSGPSEEPESSVTVCFRSRSDETVAGMGYEYAYISVAEYDRHAAYESKPPLLDWHTSEANADGCDKVTVKTSGRTHGYFYVRLLSLTWQLASDMYRAPGVATADAADYTVFEVSPPHSKVIVVVDREVRISVDIKYADQAPFEGTVTVSYWAKGVQSAGPLARINVGSTGLVVNGSGVTLEVPESAQWLNISTVGYRLGWKNPFCVEIPLNTHARSLTVVIPESSEPRCAVHVELDGFRENEGWEMHIQGEAIWSTFGKPNWGGLYRNYTLLAGLEYVIRISGPRGVWESEPFVLEEKEVRVFKPQVAEPITVRCRVVDELGKPVTPCFASTRYHAMPNWHTVRKLSNQILQKRKDGTVDRRELSNTGNGTAGDTEGVIILKGVPSNITKLYVEAQGCERTTVELSAKPGVHVDLGDVVVVTAVGSITVRFKNMASGEQFRVAVMKLRQGFEAPVLTDGSDTHTFSALSVNRGTYTVWASRGNGFTPVQVQVTLSAEHPVQEVEIDANQMTPGGPSLETDTGSSPE
ncbi:MAG: hypothetical protein H6841_04870 [Planctomycetes bacterium]|nr:hypothetical protein [Planctomycetota bacterium]MCB9934947.1 hypothetical protein [Planctomycetota bacterium]